MNVNVKINGVTVNAELESSEMEKIKESVYANLIGKLCESYNESERNKLTDAECQKLFTQVKSYYYLMPGYASKKFEIDFVNDVIHDSFSDIINNKADEIISNRIHTYAVDFSYRTHGTIVIKAKSEEDVHNWFDSISDEEILSNYATDCDDLVIEYLDEDENAVVDEDISESY